MSRRMVISCDACRENADMAYPEAARATSASMFGPAASGFSIASMKPQPPTGWFERYAGLRGILDFCSVACVQAWDERHKDAVFA